MILLIQLLLAHILGDFFLQFDKWVINKEQKKWASPFLYLHVAIHGVLILIFSGVYFWMQALIIVVLHLLVDGMKLQFQTNTSRRTWFFADQFLHILTIIIVWIVYSQINISWDILSNTKLLILVFAILFVTKPTSLIIKMIVAKWSPEAIGSSDTDSLQRAGTWIGVLERLLILTFMLNGRWEGVGFLLAAKSIFRFGDLRESKDRKLTEYILIGTLLSFGITILVSLVTIYFLKTFL